MRASRTFRTMTTKSRTSPAMRVIAAVVLVCWSVALTTCWHHCATNYCGGSPVAGKQASCHQSQKSDCNNCERPTGENSSTSSCFANRPVSAELNSSPDAAPILHLAYLSALFLFNFELPDSTDNVSPRQASPRDWVFTPEVCLGPAFRALAPPAFV